MEFFFIGVKAGVEGAGDRDHSHAHHLPLLQLDGATERGDRAAAAALGAADAPDELVEIERARLVVVRLGEQRGDRGRGLATRFRLGLRFRLRLGL